VKNAEKEKYIYKAREREMKFQGRGSFREIGGQEDLAEHSLGFCLKT
jgi:hypothetical protein